MLTLFPGFALVNRLRSYLPVLTLIQHRFLPFQKKQKKDVLFIWEEKTTTNRVFSIIVKKKSEVCILLKNCSCCFTLTEQKSHCLMKTFFNSTYTGSSLVLFVVSPIMSRHQSNLSEMRSAFFSFQISTYFRRIH